MALFGFLNKNKEDKKAKKQKEKEQKKKKKRNMMADFFDESVLENSLVELKENPKFAFEDENGMDYITILTDSENFGGFNRKSKKKESIGQMIEQIQSGNIKCIMTPELMDEGELLIIPDEKSLYTASQFSELSTAPYNIVFVNDDMEFDKTDKVVSFEDVVKFSKSKDNVITFLNNNGFEFEIANVEEEDESLEEEDESLEEEYVDEDFVDDDFSNEDLEDDDIPFGDDVDGDLADNSQIDEDNYNIDSEEELYNSENSEDSEDYMDEDYTDDDFADEDYTDEEIEDNENIEISEQENENLVKQRLMSSELDLNLTTEPFDSAFKDAELIPLFPENRPDGWIHRYLNEQSRLNNVNLRSMRSDNINNLKRSYFSLGSAMAKEIEKKYSLNGDNKFAEWYQKINDIKEDKLNNLDREADETESRLKDKREKEIQSVRDFAADDAESKYRQRHDKAFYDECREVKVNLRTEIESSFNSEFKKLEENRKDVAHKDFEASISELISDLTNEYVDNIESEKRTYDKMSEDLKSIINDNRKDEIKRAEALSERNENDNRVAQNYKEYQEKLNAVNEEMKLNSDRLVREKQEAIAQKDLYIKEKMSEYDEEIQRLNKNNEELQRKNDRLYEDSKIMRDNLKAEYAGMYEARLLQKDNDYKSLSEKFDNIVKLENANNKKISYGRVATTVFAIIASLAVGGVFSHFLTLNNVNKQMEDTMKERIEEKLTDVEEKYDKKEKELQDEIDKKNSENEQLKNKANKAEAERDALKNQNNSYNN